MNQNQLRYVKKSKKLNNRQQSRRSEIPVCAKCSSEDVMEDADRSMDLIDELTQLAGHTSASVTLISMDTEEGATLFDAFGGITALLRYSIS